nr:MAG TPA: hypothetical protein [Caudoviricetes sp.]
MCRVHKLVNVKYTRFSKFFRIKICAYFFIRLRLQCQNKTITILKATDYERNI